MSIRRNSGGLKRRPASREPYKRIHMVFEGRITEPEYIDSFIRSRKEKVAVPGIIVRGAGEPKSIITKCVEIRDDLLRDSKLVSIGRTDDIWAIFDVDEHEHLIDAIHLAKENNFFCAISNPCIEVWGFMHKQKLDRPLSRHEAQKGLKDILPRYHHKKNPRFDWQWCSDKIHNAVRNAVAGRAAREAENSKFPHDIPSTNFDRLLSEFDPEIRVISGEKTWSEW